MKNIGALSALIIALFALQGCFHEEKTVIEVPIMAAGDCCVTSNSCASGTTVTREFCVQELQGTFHPGKACDDANQCS